MNDQDRKRIDGYIQFLRRTFRFLTWTGVGLMAIGVIIGLAANGTAYFQLSPGFLFIGGVLMLRAIFQSQKLPKTEDIGNPQYFESEVLELVSKIKFFSFFLIISVMSCVLVAFIAQWRFMIPTLIILTVYVVAEYTIWILIRFRLQLLKQELRIE